MPRQYLAGMAASDSVIDWLLDSDPSIRWQVMRDLLDAPQPEWTAERAASVPGAVVGRLVEGAAGTIAVR